MDIISKSRFVWIYVTALLLYIVGYFLRIYNFDDLYWFMRIVIAITFLSWILYYTSRKIPVKFYFFFFFFIAGAFCALNFEKSPYDTLYIVCNILSIFFLILYISFFLNYKKMSFLLWLSFTVTLLLNGYFVYELVKEVSSHTVNSFHHALFVISGSSILLLVFVALFYNHIDSTKRSMNFLIFSILFVFYHIFLVMGHYGIGYSSSITLLFSRALLIFSFVFLSRYMIFYHEHKQNKVLPS